MKQERLQKKIIVNDKAKNHLQKGHPWVYDSDIISIDTEIQDGDIIDVISLKNTYLGSGFFNSHSKIQIRVFSTNANDIFNEAFFKRRLTHALEYRKTVMGKDYDNCRLIFGEADYFPGLTVDRFNDILVVQVLSLGIEQRKDMIFSLLYQLLLDDNQIIHGVYERNDVSIREKEGLPMYKGWYTSDIITSHPKSSITTIKENDIIYDVDVENGQKTGFFLDQKYNRLSIHNIVKGKRVLDCFCHTGSFALNACKAGASYVHAVDISKTAIEMAKKNAKNNHLEENLTFEVANVFDVLKELKNKPRVYDVIILDPPAFTKSRNKINRAIKGYKEINKAAMQLLPRGGYLITCSCSHFMNEGLFKTMLHDAAKEANVTLRQIEARQQSSDHPILWNVPETNYLKFYLFQIA